MDRPQSCLATVRPDDRSSVSLASLLENKPRNGEQRKKEKASTHWRAQLLRDDVSASGTFLPGAGWLPPKHSSLFVSLQLCVFVIYSFPFGRREQLVNVSEDLLPNDNTRWLPRMFSSFPFLFFSGERGVFLRCRWRAWAGLCTTLTNTFGRLRKRSPGRGASMIFIIRAPSSSKWSLIPGEALDDR